MKIVLITRPGHFRESLVALIRTLPGVQLTCHCNYRELHSWPFVIPPRLVIVDDDIEDTEMFNIRRVWPETKIISIVDSIGISLKPYLLEADGFFVKSLSAGEFISNIHWYLFNDCSATKQRLQHSTSKN